MYWEAQSCAQRTHNVALKFHALFNKRTARANHAILFFHLASFLCFDSCIYGYRNDNVIEMLFHFEFQNITRSPSLYPVFALHKNIDKEAKLRKFRFFALRLGIVQLLSSKIVHFYDKRMKLCQFTIIPKTIIFLYGAS